jgi:acetyl-CoA acetyltransferase
VAVLGTASAQTHWNISMMRDFTTTAAVTVGRDVFARAGLSPEDVDVFECYDSFTITVLLLLEDLGFCPKGEGGAFAASGAIGPGGTLPVNTVRQLRGTAYHQVEGAEVALACGVGAWLSCIGAVLLGMVA